MNKNKLKIILTGIILVLIILLIVIFMYNKNNKDRFNVSEVEKEITQKYKDLNLYALDKYDISLYLGLEYEEIPSSLFLTDFEQDEEDPKPFSPKSLVVVINTNDVDKYYDYFKDFVNYHISSTEDKKEIKRYDKAILEKGSNYVYFILGKDKKDIEKTILDFKN